jgi:hypothetical protein
VNPHSAYENLQDPSKNQVWMDEQEDAARTDLHVAEDNEEFDGT